MARKIQPIIIIFFFILFSVGSTKSVRSEIPPPNRFLVGLGEEFQLKKGQRVGLKETEFELEILAFFNHPCPPNVKCVWSGIGIEFEYRCDGQLKKGINLVKVFGYQITVVGSDYESYAVLKITRNNEQ
jgi:hypothetical protein